MCRGPAAAVRSTRHPSLAPRPSHPPITDHQSSTTAAEPVPDDTPLRQQIARTLDWEDAHAGFDSAVKGLAPALRGRVPAGLPYSAWQIVEHIRRTQADI